jgi:aminoglycoside 3-N-acetyltransferase I
MQSDNHISVKKLSTLLELRELIAVFSAAFESPYVVDDEYLQNIFSHKTVVLGGFFEGKVVGGLVAFEVTPLHDLKELYIYDLAGHPTYQKRGVGKKLIQSLRGEAKARGVKTVFVEAEAEDEGAVAFYRKLNGEEEDVRHFNFSVGEQFTRQHGRRGAEHA